MIGYIMQTWIYKFEIQLKYRLKNQREIDNERGRSIRGDDQVYGLIEVGCKGREVGM